MGGWAGRRHDLGGRPGLASFSCPFRPPRPARPTRPVLRWWHGDAECLGICRIARFCAQSPALSRACPLPYRRPLLHDRSSDKSNMYREKWVGGVVVGGMYLTANSLIEMY